MGPKLLFIVSDDAMHYMVIISNSSTIYYYCSSLYFPSNPGPLPKHTNISQQHDAQGDGKEKQEGENRWYAYRQRENMFLIPDIEKKKIALYPHLRNAEQLFTAWGFTKKTQESHLVS